MAVTPRIRFPAASDAPVFAQAVQESLGELLPWMSWATPEYHDDQAMEWIEKQEQARLAGTEFNFLIVDAMGGFLGTCGINQINHQHGFANLGYWVRSKAAGQGIAAEAVRQLKDWVFSNTDLERLEIIVGIGNRRSERVAEKAGAHREGVLRSRLQVRGVHQDATIFSLVRARFRA